jgi:ankyrin repeat protein
MRAVMKNNPEVAKVVLEHGADPNVIVKSGDTSLYPLFIAAMDGYTDVVRVLIENGVDVTAKVPGSASPLEVARHKGHEAVAKLINAAIKKKTAAEMPQRGRVTPARSASLPSQGRSTPVELVVSCIGLRYDEYEHGKQFSRIFAKARAEWVKSKNDLSSPSYAKACKMVTDWFTADYRVPIGLSMTFGMDEDNVINRVTEVGAVKDSSEAAHHAFADEPRLKSFEVVSLDFRLTATQNQLQDKDKLGFSPEISAIAVYQVKPGKKLGSPKALQDFLSTTGAVLASCFSIQIKDEAIETIEIDDDGGEYTSVNSSYIGGEIEVKVNVDGAGDFVSQLRAKAQDANRTPVLLGVDKPESKRLLMLGDEEGLKRLLDEGLTVDTKVDDETLLKISLMLAVTASTWFDHEELSSSLKRRFSNAEDYAAALKRIALDLLDRGADVNVTGGNMTVLALSEALNDPDILTICRSRATSVDDSNSTALLLAGERGDVAALSELLDRGARINKRHLQTGDTPLMLASQGPDGEDAPPLSGMQLECQEAAVRLLIDRGARLDARSERGDTAIGNAVRRGNVSIVEILLKAGAKTKDALPKGQELLDLAEERGHKLVVDLLQREVNRAIAKPKAM